MSAVDTLFFDLDDTLYPHGNGIWSRISERINQYMTERVGLSPQEADSRRQRYWRSFGTSLTGLMVDFQVDPHDYLAFVHDIPLEELLRPDPQLRRMLQGIQHRKFVFTNASEAHARRVTRCLAVEGAFDGFISIEALGMINKPDLRAYARALELAGNPDPARCLLIDDHSNNLLPARQLGMRTVLVGPGPAAGADYHIDSIQQLVAAVPELQAPPEESDGRHR